MKRIMMYCLCMFICVACSTPATTDKKTTENSTQTEKQQTQKNKSNTQNDTAYKPSTIESTFPVPKDSVKTDKKSKKSQMPYVRYDYTGLDQMGKRQSYFAHLRKLGWKELKNEQLGRMHVFSNNGKQIHMTIHQDYFTIFIPKTQANEEKETSKQS